MKETKQVVFHKCPKRGSHFPIDTKQTPVCPHCKFRVSNLVIKSHKFMKIALISNFIPLVILLTLMFTSQWEPWVMLLLILPMHLGPFFAGRFLIAQNSLNWLNNLTMQEANWIKRIR